MKKALIAGVAALALMSAVAYAQMQHGPGGDAARSGGTMGSGAMHGNMQGGMMHGGMKGMMQGGMAQTMQPKGDNSPSSIAFHGVNMKMHGAMDVTYSGNADVDFVAGMIPHHAGAIDMAKVVLAFGKDPEVKKLAEDIIKAQESEITLMRNWLEKNAK
jgi:uncharacterized protein (DUF305 family)